MRIILVRHGQTKWNSEGRVQGRTDIPLNARGMAQAEAVGEWLSGRKLDAVYASPLMRAHDTAKAIADRQGVCVKLLGEMIEIDFGLWEGKTSRELSKEFPEFWVDWSWHLDEEKSAMMRAESAYSILARAKRAVGAVMEENAADATVAIVSHTMPIKLLMADAVGIPLENMRQVKVDNCGVCEIEPHKGEQSKLITWNERGFLMRKGLI